MHLGLSVSQCISLIVHQRIWEGSKKVLSLAPFWLGKQYKETVNYIQSRSMYTQAMQIPNEEKIQLIFFMKKSCVS